MKKLIALIAGTAVMLSMSMTSFAAFDTEIVANEDGTYTAALAADAATANAGKQTTIVAYKGDAIEVGSIQYINQDAADNFTFQLKDALTADVKVVMGGEAIAKQEIGTIKYVAPSSGYTVSGTVTDPSMAEMDWDGLVEEIGEELVDYFKEAWGTKAILVADDEEHTALVNYLLAYLGEEADEVEAVATATIDAAGAFSFAEVADGNYAVIIERAGALPLFTYATVDGANVALDNKALIMGDIFADICVDGGDIGVILEAFNKGYFDEDPEYDTAYDVTPDWCLDGGDIGVMLTNFNVGMADYGEAAIDDVLAMLE